MENRACFVEGNVRPKPHNILYSGVCVNVNASYLAPGLF